MTSQARVLASTQDAPWLPPGGRAAVVLAGGGDDPPEPTCLVRLLSALLGYVRNMVATPADGYPWPVPEAHFAVWVSDLEAGRGRRARSARWLDRHEAEEHLGERHWWPLAATYLAGRGRPTPS